MSGEIARALLLVSALVAAAACTAPAQAQEPKPAAVVLANPAISLSFSASYLAEDLGIFKGNGLEVRTVLLPGVDKVLAAAFATIRKISPYPPRIDAKGLDNVERFNIDAGLMKPEDKLASYDGLYTNEFVK